MKRTAALVVAAAACVLVTQDAAAAEPVTTERAARALIDQYRHDAVAVLPGDFRYAVEAATTFQPCPDKAGQYVVANRYDVAVPPGTPGAVGLTALRQYWSGQGYQVVNDAPGQNAQLLTEDGDTGFRIGISVRAANFLRLAISSSCLTLGYVPVEPVLPQEQASVREAYETYVAGVLDHLIGDVAALRTALASGDRAKARTVWLTAQLTWDRVGSAYGSFNDYTDAIAGLPQGLPAGVRDPDFTGLRRIEYGLWHDEAVTGLGTYADDLAGTVAELRDDLPGSTPDAIDLPLRVHEILEDALRFRLTGQTDMGGHTELTETAADADATGALLDLFGPLLDERRPDLRPEIHTELDALRGALTERRNVAATLGRVLETLAQAPGLLEVTDHDHQPP